MIERLLTIVILVGLACIMVRCLGAIIWQLARPKIMESYSSHRWSGWPGAVCLDCGIEDPREIALADGMDIDSVLSIECPPCDHE